MEDPGTCRLWGDGVKSSVFSYIIITLCDILRFLSYMLFCDLPSAAVHGPVSQMSSAVSEGTT